MRGGISPSTKPNVYMRWAMSVPVKLGDALFFLYPPSQDSAVQVTAKAFAACDVSGPLLKLEDGNSVFNLTKPGRAYFTSAAPGRCRKGQKLSLDVPGADEKMLKPSTDDSSGSAKSARMTSCAGSASSPTDLLVPDAKAAAEEATTFRARPPRRGRRHRGLHGRCQPVLL
uniref:Phytocyanin domain-containing protein n=1 Tax=Aegilops tauschii subsp. strangulata TaxID=200361 RepID=A0A453FU37_AEGTS